MRISCGIGCSVACVGAVALIQTTPQPVKACTVPYVPPSERITVTLTSTSVPADGVLAGIVSTVSCQLTTCVTNPSGPGMIYIFDQAGDLVPGSMLPTGLPGWFTFRPTNPWIAGASYWASTTPQIDRPNLIFFGAVPPTTAEVTVAATLATVERSTTSVRCAEYDPIALGGSCGVPSFYANRVLEAQLTVTLAEAPRASQYRYRVSWSADEQNVGVETSSGLRFTRTFAGVPREVCYEIFATPLANPGDERRLAAGCEPTDPDALGERDEANGAVTDTLSACLVPPQPYRERWCQVMTDPDGRCNPAKWRHLPGGSPACMRAAAECPKDDMAAPGSGEPSEDGETDSERGEPKVDAPMTDSHGDPPQDGESGCSLGYRARHHALSVLLGALSLALLHRRAPGARRRNRRD